MIRKTRLILRLAARDLKGTASVQLLALLILGAAFLALGIVLLAAVNLHSLAGQWGEKIQMCVYLVPGISAEARRALERRLQALPEVKAVVYQSEEEALAEFRRMVADESDLLAGLEENPLPASFSLQMKPGSQDAETVSRLAGEIRAWPGVEEVDDAGEWLEQFTALVRGVKLAGLVASALLALAVFFIISNTLRLTLYSRREEIYIMRLVGASPLLIRLPFVLEGGLQGAAGAALAMGLLWLIYRFLLAEIAWPGLLAGFTPLFLSFPALLFFILAGASLGMAASLTRFPPLLKAGEP